MNDNKTKPIAFVIPWYGDNIRGGAEAECNQLAHCFQDAGVAVEVLTTCVKEAADDRGINTLPQGKSIESGIIVRRFLVKKRNEKRFHAANARLYNKQMVSRKEEAAYFEENINSPDLYAYIADNKDNYKLFVFIPYLYSITYYGSMECPENAVIIPCLHDEGYAYMSMVRERLQCFKKMIFLSKPESDLAHELYDLQNVKTAVLGAYVESGWEDTVDAGAFRKKYHIYDDFILFAGRKDKGKKADLLLEYFYRYKRVYPEDKLKLVFIGGGKIDIPMDIATEVIDLGFLDITDKHNAFAAALVLCNPSYFESFSIVIMESWLVHRPVLVSENCKVTTHFCMESNGGLYFNSYPVFERCLKFFLTHKDITDALGQNGYRYVQKNFVKDVIQKKYLDFLLI